MARAGNGAQGTERGILDDCPTAFPASFALPDSDRPL